MDGAASKKAKWLFGTGRQFNDVVTAIEGGNRGWMMVDNKRSSFNPVERVLDAQSSGTENAGYTEAVDFLSNGFKLKATHGNFNVSGETHIYLAWGEMPFKYATAR